MVSVTHVAVIHQLSLTIIYIMWLCPCQTQCACSLNITPNLKYCWVKSNNWTLSRNPKQKVKVTYIYFLYELRIHFTCNMFCMWESQDLILMDTHSALSLSFSQSFCYFHVPILGSLPSSSLIITHSVSLSALFKRSSLRSRRSTHPSV